MASELLTSEATCKKKHTYYKSNTAKDAVRRRNHREGIKFTSKYRCNVCNYWHLTTRKASSNENPTNNN